MGTASQNAARFLMAFGLVIVLASFGMSLQRWSLTQDVWDRADTFEEPLNPASSTDEEVRADWQDIQTINGWETNARLVGLGSLLAAILLTFRYGICKAAGTVRFGLPKLWQAYLAAVEGEPAKLREGIELYKLQEEA